MLPFEERMRQRPLALKIVAWLFILGGALAWFNFCFGLAAGTPRLDVLDALDLFIGIGLLRLRPGWRTLALVLLWGAMLITGMFSALVLMKMVADPSISSLPRTGQPPLPMVFLLALALFGFAVWQYLVLVREDVRALLGLSDDTPSDTDEKPAAAGASPT